MRYTAMLACALATAACGGGEGSSGEPAGDGAITLDSCETSFGEGVPEFYQQYFSCVSVELDGGDVVIRSNGLPPHPSAYYDEDHPNWIEFDSQGGTHFLNPNRVSEQAHSLRVPSSPVAKGLTIDGSLVDGTAGTPEEYHSMSSALGLALDGVAIFHGVAAPGDDIEMEQYSFDAYEGHPQDKGVYHYHGASPGPLEVIARGGHGAIELYGVMCDGTLVLGCTELDGSTPSGALDAQNGHVHDLADAAGTTHFSGRYHTHVCPALFPDHEFAPEVQYYEECL